MSDALLRFEGVSFGYSHRRLIFSGLEYGLEKGSLAVILGPNGAGKTTLLYMALGWLLPNAGTVSLGNRPLQSYTRGELGRRISLVPQEEHLPYTYSVLEYVQFGRAPHLTLVEMPSQADQQVAREALERAGIASLADDPMDKLSSGERQLAVIARALAQEPEILLLDEPTSHLDLGNQYRLLQTLKELNRAGVTILMTTHDPQIALAISTQTVLVEGNGKVRVGPAEQILTAETLTHLYHLPAGAIEIRPNRPGIWLRQL